MYMQCAQCGLDMHLLDTHLVVLKLIRFAGRNQLQLPAIQNNRLQSNPEGTTHLRAELEATMQNSDSLPPSLARVDNELGYGTILKQKLMQMNGPFTMDKYHHQ